MRRILPSITSGATNIFKYPELADTARASQLISALEDKKELVDMLKGNLLRGGG